MATVDHRRAAAERSRAAIVDAAARLLGAPGGLTMASLAAAAGVSRPTLYAHFKTLPDVVAAVVEQSVRAAVAAIEAVAPEEGPADEAVRRLLAASWGHLAADEAVARGAAEHLGADRLHAAHAPLAELLRELIVRGQADGTFRTDLPEAWLARTCIALVHAADEAARAGEASRETALEQLQTSVADLFRAPRP